MIDFTWQLTGRGNGLLMHNGRLSNPLDPIVQEIKVYTCKRTKTDDDHREIARLELIGGLYYDADIGPYIPAENLHSCLLGAAKKHKMGPKVKEGILILTDVNPLAYAGPREADKLAADKNFWFLRSAKVGQQRVMRSRALFGKWSLAAEGSLDESVLNWKDLDQIVATAGYRIGLGDWRPRFGLFDSKLIRRNGNGT